MTFQWMAISFFLYAEILLTLLLILPLLRPSMWKRIFNIQLFASIQPIWTTTFYAILVIIIFLFADSIRQMMKYNKPDESTMQSFDTKMDRLFRECRGQRNFYITGFALFLMFVIKRLISMISQHATLSANYEAVLKQASNANAELSRRLDNEGKEGKDSKDGKGGPSQKEFESLQKELRKTKADHDAMKKQAEATSTEYDRLTSEFQKLQNEVQKLKSDEDKKDV